MNPDDKTFIGYGSYPNMERHVPNEQKVTIQNMATLAAVLNTSTTLPTFGAQSFSLNTFGTGTGLAFSNALTVFDQYKIDLIETWLVSRSPTDVNVSNSGVLTSAVDLDDAIVPTVYAAVQGYGSSLTASGGAGHYHRWRPHVALAAYSGVFTSFANEECPWIDSASPGVQCYGLKFASSVTSAIISYDLLVRMTVSFRSSF
jgi:hypothetical protein